MKGYVAAFLALIGIYLFYLALIVTFCVGWVINLINVVQVAHTVTATHVPVIWLFEVAGIFIAPLGGLLGLLHLVGTI